MRNIYILFHILISDLIHWTTKTSIYVNFQKIVNERANAQRILEFVSIGRISAVLASPNKETSQVNLLSNENLQVTL